MNECARSAYFNRKPCKAELFELEQVEIELGVVACTACFRKVIESKNNEIKTLEAEVITDTLTKVQNRRGLQKSFDSFVERFADERVPFGMVQFDHENFKIVNDTLGYDVGDQVLSIFGGILLNSRETDSLARNYDPSMDTVQVANRPGGDEFAQLASLKPREPSVLNDKREAIQTYTHEEMLKEIGRRKKAEHENHPDIRDINQQLPPDKQTGVRFAYAVYKAGMTLDDLNRASNPKPPGSNIGR
jgi:diguanylate cyclase (GGDEF)-like protein